MGLANNNIKTGSKILREYHHANLYKNGVNCSIKHLNLSNNLIDDTSASIIASHIQKGEVPHLKTLDVSGNLLTKVGEGYLANAVTKMSQNCAILVKKMEIIGVESFKSTIKVMLDIAKSNGIRYASGEPASIQSLSN